MSSETGQDRDLITGSIKSSLLKVQKFVNSRQKTNSRLMVASMAFSGASTLVAGITSAGGPIVGSGIEGWRLACIIAAIFGLTSTVSTGISQQLDATDRLSKGKECLTRLRTLDLGITTGKKNWEEIIEEYQELAINHPELVS